jgi:hypothetical protein
VYAEATETNERVRLVIHKRQPNFFSELRYALRGDGSDHIRVQKMLDWALERARDHEVIAYADDCVKRRLKQAINLSAESTAIATDTGPGRYNEPNRPLYVVNNMAVNAIVEAMQTLADDLRERAVRNRPDDVDYYDAIRSNPAQGFVERANLKVLLFDLGYCQKCGPPNKRPTLFYCPACNRLIDHQNS